MSSQTVLLALHLIGLAFGIGASTILDLRTLRLLYGRPVSEQDLAFAEVLSTFVRIGLLLLLISGLGLLLRLWLSDPALLANPKLHAKLTIVGMLTLNGFLIETIALPLLRRQCGRPLFEGVCYRTQVAVLAMGVVSATSWYLPFLLGIARELNFGPSALTILSAYLALICLGVVAALAWRFVHYRPPGQAAITRHPGVRPAAADDWSGRSAVGLFAVSSSARATPASSARNEGSTKFSEHRCAHSDAIDRHRDPTDAGGRWHAAPQLLTLLRKASECHGTPRVREQSRLTTR